MAVKYQGGKAVPVKEFKRKPVYRTQAEAERDAQEESKQGYVVHVERRKGLDGKPVFSLSDFYESGVTVASYENGRKKG